MITIRNTSGEHQVIPSKGGSKDLPAGSEDSFDVDADNPHVQAKVRAGKIEIVEDDASAPVEAAPTTSEPDKPVRLPRSKVSDIETVPGGTASTL